MRSLPNLPELRGSRRNTSETQTEFQMEFPFTDQGCHRDWTLSANWGDGESYRRPDPRERTPIRHRPTDAPLSQRRGEPLDERLLRQRCVPRHLSAGIECPPLQKIPTPLKTCSPISGHRDSDGESGSSIGRLSSPKSFVTNTDGRRTIRDLTR